MAVVTKSLPFAREYYKVRWEEVKKVAFLIAILCLSLVVLAGCENEQSSTTRIDLPAIESVARIEMAYYDIINDRRTSVGIAVIENQNDINTIMYSLSEARLSNRWGANNDNPLVAYPWLRVFIYGDESLMGRIFLYTMGNRGYVFDAYRGLYRIDPDIITAIYQM